MTVDSINSHFACQRCGHCCEGSGGIVVSNADLERLCVHFGINADGFADRYGQRRGGKLHVRSGADGCCVFFVRGHGCGVHEARPDICRAWPYFRGNLSDSGSFAMAKLFCPGIPERQSHEDFVREGLASLGEAGICGRGGADEATALQLGGLFAKGGGAAGGHEGRSGSAKNAGSIKGEVSAKNGGSAEGAGSVKDRGDAGGGL